MTIYLTNRQSSSSYDKSSAIFLVGHKCFYMADLYGDMFSGTVFRFQTLFAYLLNIISTYMSMV